MPADAPVYFLGVDIGTTNAKVVLIDTQARVVRSASREYPVDYPRPGWAEQNPATWWSAVRELLAEVVRPFPEKSAIRALGVSGQMHGLVALDAQREVIRPAMLWCDQRTQPQCDAAIAACGGLDGLLRLTNNHMLTGYTAPKILWLRDHEPESFRRIATVLLPKDYIRYQLTGDTGTDVSDASGTGLFDAPNRRWSSALLAKLNLPESWFPPAHESIDLVGRVRADLAAEFGLPAGLPVIAGGGDATLQPLGSGMTDPAECLLVVGTGGNVTVPLAQNITNTGGRLQVFCGVLPGSYVALGATNAAGESLRWMRNLLRQGAQQLGLAAGAELSFADLERLARAAAPGANKTLFLPYLLGERCPHPDAQARGVFFGLSTNTTLGDLVRAILEGVAFSMRDVAAILEQQGIRLQACRIAGGGSQSETWRRIFANVFAAPISTVSAGAEGTAFGTALIAGISQGRFRSPGELQRLIPAKTIDQPDAAQVSDYAKRFALYRQLYPSLSPAFRELARL